MRKWMFTKSIACFLAAAVAVTGIPSWNMGQVKTAEAEEASSKEEQAPGYEENNGVYKIPGNFQATFEMEVSGPAITEEACADFESPLKVPALYITSKEKSKDGDWCAPTEDDSFVYAGIDLNGTVYSGKVTTAPAIEAEENEEAASATESGIAGVWQTHEGNEVFSYTSWIDGEPIDEDDPNVTFGDIITEETELNDYIGRLKSNHKQFLKDLASGASITANISRSNSSYEGADFRILYEIQPKSKEAQAKSYFTVVSFESALGDDSWDDNVYFSFYGEDYDLGKITAKVEPDQWVFKETAFDMVDSGKYSYNFYDKEFIAVFHASEYSDITSIDEFPAICISGKEDEKDTEYMSFCLGDTTRDTATGNSLEYLCSWADADVNEKGEIVKSAKDKVNEVDTALANGASIEVVLFRQKNSILLWYNIIAKAGTEEEKEYYCIVGYNVDQNEETNLTKLPEEIKVSFKKEEGQKSFNVSKLEYCNSKQNGYGMAITVNKDVVPGKWMENYSSVSYSDVYTVSGDAIDGAFEAAFTVKAKDEKDTPNHNGHVAPMFIMMPHNKDNRNGEQAVIVSLDGYVYSAGGENKTLEGNEVKVSTSWKNPSSEKTDSNSEDSEDSKVWEEFVSKGLGDYVLYVERGSKDKNGEYEYSVYCMYTTTVKDDEGNDIYPYMAVTFKSKMMEDNLDMIFMSGSDEFTIERVHGVDAISGITDWTDLFGEKDNLGDDIKPGSLFQNFSKEYYIYSNEENPGFLVNFEVQTKEWKESSRNSTPVIGISSVKNKIQTCVVFQPVKDEKGYVFAESNDGRGRRYFNSKCEYYKYSGDNGEEIKEDEFAKAMAGQVVTISMIRWVMDADNSVNGMKEDSILVVYSFERGSDTYLCWVEIDASDIQKEDLSVFFTTDGAGMTVNSYKGHILGKSEKTFEKLKTESIVNIVIPTPSVPSGSTSTVKPETPVDKPETSTGSAVDKTETPTGSAIDKEEPAKPAEDTDKDTETTPDNTDKEDTTDKDKKPAAKKKLSLSGVSAKKGKKYVVVSGKTTKKATVKVTIKGNTKSVTAKSNGKFSVEFSKKVSKKIKKKAAVKIVITKSGYKKLEKTVKVK